MTFQYPVEIARDLISMTSQFSQQSMEVHGIGLVCCHSRNVEHLTDILQIEKLFDVACSLTDVLSLLPPNPDPFQAGPRDYLHDFMTLLSALRNGDHRFLPLLLSKIHDVLPKLVNPMLQTQPEPTANILCDDIFDGFGNAGIGMPAQFNGFTGNDNASFKVEHNENDFSQQNPIIPTYEKRLDDLSSPSADSNSNPYTSPSIIQSPMEFPGLNDFGSFTEMNASQQSLHQQQQPLPTSMSMYNQMSNFNESVGTGTGRVGGVLQRPEFKRDFDQTMALLRGNSQVRNMMQNNVQNGMQSGVNMRRPPLRQNSGSSYGMVPPRSVAEHNQYQQLQRMNSAHDALGMGMNNAQDMSFR